ncbi:uncharacterized protein LOC126888096 [Diabrotica virgifera virgifera]|uniref:Reverse transcriptase domain-containing protein n=1 Tax=Diabrotica virgifera virgifera TaxID=50390 RepID=A0ABM5KPF2_DIAVI|nr:uncharacterized protein LOC126888096 [Diabrotica virgifera virgifera]
MGVKNWIAQDREKWSKLSSRLKPTKGCNATADGKQLNNLRFADDIVIIADNINEANEMLTELAEAAEEKALWVRDEGVRIGGNIINNIRFADDTAIMAENIDDLQILLEIINRESKKMELKMNIDKTKCMVISKTPVDNIHLILEGKPLERVDKYKYLGAIINSQSDQDEEINVSIEIARKRYIKYKSMFTNTKLSMSSSNAMFDRNYYYIV